MRASSPAIESFEIMQGLLFFYGEGVKAPRGEKEKDLKGFERI